MMTQPEPREVLYNVLGKIQTLACTATVETPGAEVLDAAATQLEWVLDNSVMYKKVEEN